MNLSILGATGSIGQNALEIAAMFPERFRVRALTAKGNLALLASQILRFSPDMAAVFDEYGLGQLRKLLPADCPTKIVCGQDGYVCAATHPAADMVVSAMVGGAGLVPTVAAINAGKDIALANKETLVMAGNLVMDAAKRNNVRVLPVDSEHSAIFQCIAGSRREDLEKIILTASGGPFLERRRDDFASITVKDALAHPTWQMGSKITIDSATMMNKGLEVIEAKHLFGISHESIEVLIHPQSIVHSMVAFRDGSVIAQMGVPDMKGAIAYALSHPERLAIGVSPPDFPAVGKLCFQAPDMIKFPCIALAFRACETGGTMPAVLNAANEIAVSAFLGGRIGFDRIAGLIEETMDRHGPVASPGMDDILEADRWARETAQTRIHNTEGKATA